MFPELKGTKFWSHSFHPRNSDILQTRMDQKGDPMKTNFHIFQIQKWISQTVRTQKADEKNGVFCLVSFFPSWVMVLKFPKIRHFLRICVELSKKSKSIKAIFLYPSERSHYALSENSMFHRGLSNSSRDIEDWNIKKYADSEIWRNSSTSNANIF